MALAVWIILVSQLRLSLRLLSQPRRCKAAGTSRAGGGTGALRRAFLCKATVQEEIRQGVIHKRQSLSSWRGVGWAGWGWGGVDYVCTFPAMAGMSIGALDRKDAHVTAFMERQIPVKKWEKWVSDRATAK